MSWLRLHILTVWFLCVITSVAQRFNYIYYSNKNGLPQSQVGDLHFDKRGNLWAATNAGVSMFDGKSFTNHDINSGLNNNYIKRIFEDLSGNLWFHTIYKSGISMYNGRKFTTLTIRHGLPDDEISMLFKDSKDVIWILTASGIATYSGYDGKDSSTIFTKVRDPLVDELQLYSMIEDKQGNYWFLPDSGLVRYDGKEFKLFAENEGVNGYNANYLSIDTRGYVWFVTENDGLSCYDGKNFKVYTSKDGLSHDVVHKIRCDDFGNVWIITDADGICKYDGEKFTTYTEEDGLISNAVFTLILDNKGIVWFQKTGLGASRFTDEGFITHRTSEGFTESKIKDIYWDEEGNTWFATDGDGICKIAERKFGIYTKHDGLNESTVMSIAQDTTGLLWFGTYGMGLNSYDGKVFKSYTVLKNGMVGNNIWALTVDQNNHLWVGTSKGISRFDGEKFYNYTTNDGLRSQFINMLLTDNDGSILIANGAGIDRFKDGKITEYVSSAEVNNVGVLSMVKDKKNNLWIGTEGAGLLKFDGTDFTHYTTENGLSHNYVSCLTLSKKGNLWIGTDGEGVQHFDFKNFTNYNTEDGLTNDGLMFLSVDNDNNLWAGTNIGLSKLITDENEKVTRIKGYGFLEGFVGIECNSNAVLEDDDGYFWFGSTVLTRYDSKFDLENTVEPKIKITGIRKFLKKADWSAYSDSTTGWYNLPVNLTLPYNQNHLTFDFVGTSLKIPEKVRYQYILEGLDIEWSPVTDKSEAVYSSIPPGTYTFKVKARNNDGLWNKDPVEFSFVITPPFWQTIWFYSLCMVAGIILVFLIIKWRGKKLEEQKKLLEEQVSNRTIELRREKEKVEIAYEEIGIKNKEITDSIRYAKNIQEAILPLELVQKFKDQFFVLYKPKDIVSGDFYWIEKYDSNLLIAAVDCTGHGVPGAFMSIVGNNHLNQALHERKLLKPSEILNQVNEGVTKTLSQQGSNKETVKDGMDVALCNLNLDSLELEYAGAYNPLYLMQDGELVEIKADKRPVGEFMKGQPESFTNHEIQLKKGDTFYIFSDGYADQFGGPKGKKFKSRALKEFLLNIQDLNMVDQYKALEKNLAEWQGNLDQVDDILVIGVQV